MEDQLSREGRAPPTGHALQFMASSETMAGLFLSYLNKGVDTPQIQSLLADTRCLLSSYLRACSLQALS
jgi:hypothetical protein